MLYIGVDHQRKLFAVVYTVLKRGYEFKEIKSALVFKNN